MYKIIRHYQDDKKMGRPTIKTGLTLEEAHEHCKDPETSSFTGKSFETRMHKGQYGDWFDGYTKE